MTNRKFRNLKMANPTVSTQIVVQFDDQFSDSANRALENYFKSFEEAQKKTESFKPIFETSFKEYFKDLETEFNRLDTLKQTALIASLTAGITLLVVNLSTLAGQIRYLGATSVAFYATWWVGTKLSEWLVGGQPVEEYVEGVKESMEQLATIEPLALPPIPPETVQSLETTKTCLEQVQNMQEILITVSLLDNATEQAKVIRKGIEEIFSHDITQRITIIEETIRSAAPSFSGSSDSFFDDGLPVFQTSSPDLTGFNKSVGFSPAKPDLPGFASGIDRVPRDMLALIHKDEAVLPKNLAEDFRQSGSSGMSINNLNFSFNVANGAKLDREEFRNMAFMMRDELKRLDRRIN